MKEALIFWGTVVLFGAVGGSVLAALAYGAAVALGFNSAWVYAFVSFAVGVILALLIAAEQK